MSFIKNVFSSCLGVLLAIVAAVGIIAIWGATSMSSGKSISKNHVLELTLDQVLPEQTGNVASGGFDFAPSNTMGLRDMRSLIEHASTDEKIEGILLRLSSTSMGQATLISVRDQLESFKESGKFIYAYGEAYSQSAYLLATVADSIFLNPQGGVDIRGYGAMIPFFKELMDEIGVKANIFYAGNFKSATEPFRRNDISEPNALQTRQYLEGMYGVYSELVEDARGISKAQLDRIAADALGRNAALCLEHKLVDHIAYSTEVEDMIKERIGAKVTKKLKTVSLEKYRNTFEKPSSDAKDKIAIVYAEGNVVYNDDGKGVISEKKLVDVLQRIKRKDDVKAVVLRVNSGGGSALTSDIIHHEIEGLKKAGKKIIASFGDLAASGGYYIAAGADTIVSAPNTITGSIGVFAMLPNMRELVTEKLHLNFDTIKTHPLALGLTTIYDLSTKEEDILQSSVDEIYERFTTVVAQGRGLPMETVKEIAQGRVYTGLAAKEIGLVDEIGFLDDAIKLAAISANVETYKVVEYPSIEVDPIEEIISQLINSSDQARVVSKLDPQSKQLMTLYQKWLPVLQCSEPQARLPYVLIAD